MFTKSLFWLASLALQYGQAQILKTGDPGWDLASYVSRPEFRSPLMDVTIHNASAVAPGYWFMAPYASLVQSDMGKEYAPYQAGPYIYDNEGHLVWNGAYINNNRNTFDFRLSMYGTSPVLTFVIEGKGGNTFFPDGAGIVLDTSYSLRASVAIRKPGERLNFHEFNLMHGRTSLSAIEKPMVVDISYIGIEPKTAFIANYGFREIDITSGKVLFEWFPAPLHVALPESMLTPPFDLGRNTEPWDCFHLNSVEKDSAGDYLISMRYTSTIYKISGTSGAILWRLGGKASNFVQDFNFSSQHDAKFYSYNDTTTVISFLDNASDEAHRQPWTSDASNIKLVALYEHESPMRAVLLKSFPRPDGGHTMRRGSAQFLPDGNLFAGWSRQGYMSEFTPDGRTVLEAKFVSPRFDSYRTYKFDYVGRPTEPPSLKTHAYFGLDSEENEENETGSSSSTVFYVSWNGATEVKSWEFWGRNAESLEEEEKTEVVARKAPRRLAGLYGDHTVDAGKNETRSGFKMLGEVKKAGFETTFMAEGVWEHSYAVGYSAAGQRLGITSIETIVFPNNALDVNANITTPVVSRPGLVMGGKLYVETRTETQTVKDVKTETLKEIQTQTQTLMATETLLETLIVQKTETIVSTQRVKETQVAVPIAEQTAGDSEKVVVLHTSRPILIAGGIVAVGLVLSSVVSISLLLYKRFGTGVSLRRGKYKAVSSDGGDESGAFEFDLKAEAEDVDESDDEQEWEDQMPEVQTSPRKYNPARGKRGHGRTTSVDIDGDGGGRERGRERGRGGAMFGGPLTPS